ncbi:molybdopterin molybdotransferase MoeA [Mollicutes bacterium LVI A0078]|nr:molybdopterin molybdotransferase MoeA [Mollicutes bacterium LVI A0075]WOO91574.1 molybdopterin molybdotransferase MoeA [Mollicutes bacterium LVI A0078]
MVKYEQALQLIDEYKFKHQTKTIDTFESLGYTLASNCYSNINVPGFRKSAMDGYALNSSDDLNQTFKVVETIYAGSNSNPKLNCFECVKIMTGAPIPDNCDLVIVKELANLENDVVTFNIPKTKLNSNICQIGEDIKADELLFSAGTVITPTVISSLISSGNFEIEVNDKPSILLVTTGDEVVTTNTPLSCGQIYNSNLAYLKTRLLELGFKANTIHIDDSQQSAQTIFNTKYDLIITTGAISVGDRDIIRNYIMATSPKVIFDRVNIMPGGPVVFWEHNQTPIISLAGSPFANFVTFELFARRILAHLTKDKSLIVAEQVMSLDDYFHKTIKKRRFVKANLKGNKITLPANNHLASSMHEMTLCNCLINLERGEHNLIPGDQVKVIDIRRNHE